MNMTEHNYLTIPELIATISEKATKMEKGQLSLSELSEMLELSRDLNERIAILRYAAINKPKTETKVEQPTFTKEQLFNEISTKKTPSDNKTNTEKPVESGFSLNFSVPKEDNKEVESQNQRNLLDQIQEDDNTDLSVNDKLASEKQQSIAEQLQKSKIEDLRSEIGLNQKFLFMNDLFKGEKSDYDKTIDEINNMHVPNEVNHYLTNEIGPKFNWDNTSESVKAFKALVERKFS